MELREPDEKLEESFLDFYRDYEESGEEHYVELYRESKTDFARYVRRLVDEPAGRGLPESWVPCTHCWAFEADVMIGVVRIRHRLTEWLEEYGGHVGYDVRPSRRRRGYGTMMLALAIERAVHIGLTQLLITCDSSNIGSIRVIERNGGRLRDSIIGHQGRPTNRYVLDVRRGERG